MNTAKTTFGRQPNNIWFLRIKVKHLTISVREKIAQHILLYLPPPLALSDKIFTTILATAANVIGARHIYVHIENDHWRKI